VLVEFALIALILYFLLAAIIEFGRAFHGNQVIQQAADIAARELSRTPLKPTSTFKEALEDPGVKRRIYDKHYLVIDLDNLGGQTLSEYVAKLPLVNQQLYLLMIYEEVGGKRLLRYPGALVDDNDASDNPAGDMPPPGGFLVSVPVVVSRASDGAETLEWVEVLEPIKAAAGRDDPFHLLSKEGGIVGVRINFPFQAATMSGFRSNPAGPFEPNAANPIEAKDGSVSGSPPDGGLVTPDSPVGPYAGPHSLGKQLAFGKELRPFRRLLTAQAIQRREVFK
jgi:hypothetical protein